MARIRAVIAGSAVPEDPTHADNTLAWLLRLEPGADPALRLAALGHDIERALPDRLRREAYPDFDRFKAAHARRGARVLAAILAECGLGPALREEAARLVRLHEVGGEPRADLLRDADSLSFFDVNLALYLRREGRTEALRRARWGLARLSPAARPWLDEIAARRPGLAGILADLGVAPAPRPGQRA